MNDMEGLNLQTIVTPASPVSAIILAAGYSSRMGAFKPLLPLAGQAMIDRTIACFRQAGIAGVYVVVGHRREEMKKHLAGNEARVVENPGFEAGMFSSVQAGVKALPADCPAFFMLPVDIPLVRGQTIALLHQKLMETDAPIIYPTFRGQRGHPPLIRATLRPEIEAAGPDLTLRDILAPYQAQALHMEVPDRHILYDMDTPERYREIQARWDRYDLPTDEECEILYDLFGPVPANIRRHCRMVAKVAVHVATALGERDLVLDIDLIRAAAMLHDVAKGRKSHAKVGADWLRSAGYARVADVAGCHGDLEVKPEAPISETEVVFLADKLVHEEAIYTIEERYQCSLDRYGHNPEAVDYIKIRWFRAERSRKRVEDALGGSLYELVKGMS